MTQFDLHLLCDVQMVQTDRPMNNALFPQKVNTRQQNLHNDLNFSLVHEFTLLQHLLYSAVRCHFHDTEFAAILVHNFD